MQSAGTSPLNASPRDDSAGGEWGPWVSELSPSVMSHTPITPILPHLSLFSPPLLLLFLKCTVLSSLSLDFFQILPTDLEKNQPPFHSTYEWKPFARLMN